ncbi:MAG TPA: ABC transporter permease [Gammaproteobacteria bacterium]|nr:ABC transporter permease [Gammaproteobacteria bacterium]
MQDLLIALRAVYRSPRLAIAATLCIAVGIGATVAMLTLVNAALLRELPYPESGRLVRLWTSVADANPRSGVSIPDFEDIRREARSFDAIAATARERLIFLGEERAERKRGEAVSADYFAITGVAPQLGRVFAGEETLRTGSPAMLISDATWETWFARDPQVVGRTLRVRSDRPGEDDLSYNVIGVMPAGFQGTVEDDVVEFWIPLARYGSDALRERRDARVLWTLGKLARGVSLAEAQAEFASITRGLAEVHPESNARASGWLEPVGENWRAGLRGGLLTLQVAAVLLLAIACINVANLMFARIASRGREFAARQVLGASRARVVRQLLVESLVLAGIGGLAGILLAWWIVRAFVLYSAVRIPGWLEVTVDPLVAAGAVFLMVATGIAFGALPALRGARVQLAGALRDGGRGTVAGRRDLAIGNVLVVVQISLTMVLLTGAGLLARSYQALAGAELGYRTEGVLRLAVTVNPSDYDGAEALRAFYDTLISTLQGEPGVRSVGLVFPTVPPWSGFRPQVSYGTLGGDERNSVQVHGHAIEPGFFTTMGMTLMRGRMIDPAESPDAPPVALVSRSFAELLAPGGDAIGQDFELSGTTFRIVGIAADVQYDSALPPTASQWRTERSPGHDIYWSLYQRPQDLVSIAVQTAVPPENLVEPLTRRIQALAPTSPVHWVSTMSEELAERYAEARFYMALLAGFGAAALVLAAVGLYALLGNLVVRRTGEIGVRMALGARRLDVMRSFMLRGAALAAIGLAIGAAAAFATGPAISGLLHGVSATDPMVFTTVIAFLAAVAGVAVLLPAGRAARIQPIEALRHE